MNYLRSGSTANQDKPAIKKYTAKGHDAQLQNAMYSKSQVRLQLLGKEKSVIGVIVRRDKFTITLQHSLGEFINMEEIFYKHAIESVLVHQEIASAV